MLIAAIAAWLFAGTCLVLYLLERAARIASARDWGRRRLAREAEFGSERDALAEDLEARDETARGQADRIRALEGLLGRTRDAAAAATAKVEMWRAHAEGLQARLDAGEPPPAPCPDAPAMMARTNAALAAVNRSLYAAFTATHPPGEFGHHAPLPAAAAAAGDPPGYFLRPGPDGRLAREPMGNVPHPGAGLGRE